MPKNKDAYSRYKIIDFYLRHHECATVKRLAEVCTGRLSINVAVRTIQKDIADLRYDSVLNINAPILEFKRDHTNYYYYDKGTPEIFTSIELLEEEIYALLFYAKTMSQYKGYPIFKDIANAVKKVIDNSNISLLSKDLFEKETFLETEKHISLKGIELIPLLLDAMAGNKIIEIEYQKFNNDITYYRVKPLLVKEDKQMWYILGVHTEHNIIKTLALDRIIKITVTDDDFEPEPFNSQEYFRYSFGITVMDEIPVEILISFTPFTGNYLRTLPIHHTQEIIEDTPEIFIIKLKVIPSYEFYSKILSYGSDATILSPEHIKTKFQKSFEEAVLNYKM